MLFGIIIITLLVFLATKELASSSESDSAQRLAKILTIPIIPLLVSFFLIVALRMTEILV